MERLVKIIVCLKQVLNSLEAERLINGRAPSHACIVNPQDRIALEKALEIKTTLKNAEVVALTAGPERARGALDLALARGCDGAVHLNDDAFESSDGYSISLALSKAIEKLDFSLILCGSESLDTNAAQVPTALAQFLNIPAVTRVIRIESVSHQNVRVWRRLEKGERQIIECALPALLSIDPLADEPQYVPIFALMQAADRKIQELTPDDVNLHQNDIGQEGSLVQVVSLTPPKPRSKPVSVPDGSSSLSQRLSSLFSGGPGDREKKELLQGEPEYLASRVMQYLIKEGILPEQEQEENK